jgi:PII-like signaling protein
VRVVAAKRLRIYVGEDEHYQGHPLYRAIVQAARQHGLAGATVTRGIEGFGPQSRLRTARVVDLASDLPVIVELVDEAAKIEGFLPTLAAMVRTGLITVEDVVASFPRQDSQ